MSKIYNEGKPISRSEYLNIEKIDPDMLYLVAEDRNTNMDVIENLCQTKNVKALATLLSNLIHPQYIQPFRDEHINMMINWLQLPKDDNDYYLL